MTANNKRRSVTIAEEDIISNLPGHLIDSILERLPIQDVVRTSILSKRWRYRWTTMRALVIDEKVSKKLATNGAFGRHGFIRVVNQVLLLHKGPISKFYLHIPNIFLDGFQEVDQWMLILSRNGVRELALANSNRLYQLPSHVFSCLELRKLAVQNCLFKPPLQFEGFLNLENLILEYVDFGANLRGTVINLPQLKKLFLRTCTNVYNFKINAKKLQVLLVMTCPDAMLLQLLHSQCIATVGISIQKPIEDFVRVERMNLALMLSNMPKIQCFFIDGRFLKFLIAEKPRWFPHTINSLKHLWLLNFELGDLDQLHGALCLLRNSPNLERLYIIHAHMEPQVMHHGAGSASNHLEAPDCLDQTLNQLQTVELSPLHGSRPQLLFIKLLLAHSPSLEKFTIQPSGTSDANKRLNIAKDVMRFPRASPKAEMIYLDPKP